MAAHALQCKMIVPEHTNKHHLTSKNHSEVVSDDFSADLCIYCCKTTSIKYQTGKWPKSRISLLHLHHHHHHLFFHVYSLTGKSFQDHVCTFELRLVRRWSKYFRNFHSVCFSICLQTEASPSFTSMTPFCK